MSTDRRENVTRVLARNGDDVDDLLPLVYDELRSLARAYLRRERPGHTLQPTALVHEAYLRLVDQDRVDWQGRTHFFAMGARAMRRLLIDHARGRNRAKRGGDWQQVSLDGAQALVNRGGSPRGPLAGPHGTRALGADGLSAEELLAIDLAVAKLAERDAREGKVVELRFFGGMSMEEIAEHLGVSKRTVENDWSHARAWLRRELAAG